jgi:transposase-like protein
MACGVLVTYETIRAWCATLGQTYANELRRPWPRPGDKWHLDADWPQQPPDHSATTTPP